MSNPNGFTSVRSHPGLALVCLSYLPCINSLEATLPIVVFFRPSVLLLLLAYAMLSLWNVLFPLLSIAHPAHSDSILFCFPEVSFHLPYLQQPGFPHSLTLSDTLLFSPSLSQMFSCFLSCISALLAWKVLGSRSFICTLWVTQHWDRAGNEQSANKQRQSIHVE